MQTPGDKVPGVSYRPTTILRPSKFTLLVVLKRTDCLSAFFSRFIVIYHLNLLLSLLGQQHCLDVGQNSPLGYGHSAQEPVQLLIVPDGQLEVPRHDATLLVISGSIPGQLQHLSCQVLHHGTHVDRSPRSHALSVVALAEQPMDTSHGELQTSPGGPGLGLALHLASFATSRHSDAV